MGVLMTIFLTIFAGVCVFVIGQAVMLFVIHPIHQQKETIGKVADFLIYHANRYTSPGMRLPREYVNEAAERSRREQLTETRDIARLLATELMVRTVAIPRYGWIECMRFGPKRSHIREAHQGLLFISNAMFDVGLAIQNYEQAKRIEKSLGITTDFQVEEPEANGDG